jgi:radical SAM protein with 4Fe4S-binding SPASM domain
MMGRDFFSILRSVARRSWMRDNCGLGRRVLFLDAKGDIYPCPNWRGVEHRLGNIVDTPLEGLIQHSPILSDMRERYKVPLLNACRQCDFCFWCAGDCRAEAESVAGQGAPSPYCGSLERLFPELFWSLSEG